MKLTLNSLLGAACLAIGFVGAQSTATAAAINGEIDFVGVATTDTGSLATAHSFTSFTNVFTLGNETGSYASLGDFAPVTMNGFTFNPTGSGASPLWTITSAGVTYTFDLNKVTSFVYNPSTTGLSIYGEGTALITGYEPTSGIYAFTTQGGRASSTRFTFSSATTVPDSGTTVALLGLSLVAVEGTRRALNAKRAVKA